MKRNTIVSFAPVLIRNGYKVIPITMSNKDDDSPPLVDKGYHDREFTVADAKEWRERFVGAGLALVCGSNDVYSLDFDVDDPDVARKCLYIIKKHWPTMPIRRCNPNRFATIFRASEDLQLIRNGHSEKFKIGSKLNCVELSGKGLMTMYGVHRKTGKAYRWGNKITPGKIKADELPVLNLTNIEKIFKFFGQMATAADNSRSVTDQAFSYRDDGFVEGGVLGDDGVVRDSFGWEIKPKKVKPFDDDKVKLILETFHGDDRDTWLRMGMAMHVNYQGSDDGFDMWNEWASEYDGYKSEADCRKTWDSFRLNKAKGVTLASFYAEIRKKKQQEIDEDREVPLPETLEDFEDRYIFIQNGSYVADLKMRVNESLLKLADWRNSLGGITSTISVTDGRTGDIKDKQMPIAKMWETSSQKKQVYDKIYYPSHDRMVEGLNRGDKQLYYNTYSPPFIIPVDERDKIPLFTDHLKYLFPAEGDVEWMVNWLAQLVQDPLNRHRVTPLSISTFHGTGRGWFGQVMMQLVGMSNVSTIQSIEMIIRPGAKTGFLDETTLCLVNETYVNTKEKYEINNRLRNLLGDNFQNVDVKYGAESSKNIHTRFLFQSNHIDAMALDDKDTRIEVFLNRNLPKDKAYYTKIYSLLKPGNDFIDQLYCWLMDQEVDEGMLQSSRRSKARETMIKASKSPTGSGFYEFKQVVGDGCFTKTTLSTFLSSYQSLNSPDYIANPKEVSVLLRDNVQASTVMEGKTGRTTVLSFDAIDFDKTDRRVIINKIRDVKSRIELFFEPTEKNDESI